jgi:hypothetical protein
VSQMLSSTGVLLRRTLPPSSISSSLGDLFVRR